MNNTINQNSTNFKAKLYNTKGMLVKCPNFLELASGKDIMALKGSPSTDIFVNAIRSKKVDKFGDYKISADLRIQNPLFGNQSFTEIIDDRHASACKDEIDELNFLDILVGSRTDNCKRLENKALYMQILDNIKVNSKKSGFVLDNFIPSKILEKMLKETPKEQHGFSEDRIKDFQKIASNMDESLIKEHKLNDYEWFV